ncbi:MAG: hypothetical protein GW906_02430 [Epsilonproteobacteria bacterium]|nr:hypothetical protein [Campylobacterota bacterium]PIP10353.1 MAG: hypothetical protein COX50_06205 [Sulfurimonas sp. CG23_combo_of_CG06-09_8_20_14_all_36_33]PIS23825.1 MAG: hypothetical protein COT46_11595 [Sulfurimonas sp. CG08_land_8_20_14_0_20_36_33]PIU34788.1 MAG: hypothetical protein COT05_06165 [Sulfurimonas sp. CG07_land_8_20_14_0_80_36_56]PIV05532.1 MAG: hypothetical protein COS56_00925 [Sulfurimonas sp. CG03_land_8_20_14_0_80_36_25]PIV36927.1 MAG: hypothetical protein COS32_00930 [S
MDGYPNLVEGFLDECGIDTQYIKILRSNDSPTNEELLLRALFNNHFKATVLPSKFQKEVLKVNTISEVNTEQTACNFLEALLPSQQDIEIVNIDVEEDRKLLNDILVKYGEQRISDSLPENKKIAMDESKLLMTLAQIIINQTHLINKLEKRISTIEEIAGL